MMTENSESNNTLRVPHKGDCSDADSGYDDPGVISIPVVRTVIHNGSDGRKSSTTKTEWVSFKKKDSSNETIKPLNFQKKPSETDFKPEAPSLHQKSIEDDASESRFYKEMKNETDKSKTYRFIGRPRLGRGPPIPTIRDVAVSNSIHLKEETTRRTPRRKIRSKSADAKGSQNLFSPTYSKTLSPETMRKRREWAEILKRDNILEEEYYKLPYEDINREIILGHRLSISETRLNILKGFQRIPKQDREYDYPEFNKYSTADDRSASRKSRFDNSFENKQNFYEQPVAESIESTNAATNDLKNLIEDLISGTNLGVNFSLSIGRPHSNSNVKNKTSINAKRAPPVPKPRNSLKNKSELPVTNPRTFCDDAILSSLDEDTLIVEVETNNTQSVLANNAINCHNNLYADNLKDGSDNTKERLIPLRIESPDKKSTLPLYDKQKLTKHELLNQKIDDYIDNSILKPTFGENHTREILSPFPYSPEINRWSPEYHPLSNFPNIIDETTNIAIPPKAPNARPRAKSKASYSSDEGIVNVSYSSQGSTNNSKDDLTVDDNSPKFSNLKRGRKKLKKKVSFSTESDEMFYPSTDSDSCAFDDEGSPIDADSGSESCLDEQELVVVRSFEVEGPFSIKRPIIQYLDGSDQTAIENETVVEGPFRICRPVVQNLEGTDQTTFQRDSDATTDRPVDASASEAHYRKILDKKNIEGNNNEVDTAANKQLNFINGKKDKDFSDNKKHIHFETNILPADEYFKSYLTKTKNDNSTPTAGSKVRIKNSDNKEEIKMINDGNCGQCKQSYQDKNVYENGIPSYENMHNSRLPSQQIYSRDPSSESAQSQKMENVSPFKGDYVNIQMTRGPDFTEHEIYLRTRMRTQKPVVTVTRMKVPFSSIRDQWEWVSPMMLQHKRTFDALARDFRWERNMNRESYNEHIVPISYQTEGEITTPTSSCGSPTFSGSSSGCYSAPCSPSPSSPRNKAATLPTPL